MKQYRIGSGVILVLLVTLTGCSRVIDWGVCNFYQGITVDQLTDMSCPYLRTIIIYDQFTTRGLFDVLWLSDTVRTAYSKAHAHRLGKNKEQENIFLRRQLAENDHYISFIVLSLHEIPLGDPLSPWSVLLIVNKEIYSPVEIKPIDLVPEYQSFFMYRYNRFKTSYMIKFEAKDINDIPLINDQTHCLGLMFRTLDKEGIVTWKLNQNSQDTPCDTCNKALCCPPVNHAGCAQACLKVQQGCKVNPACCDQKESACTW